MSTKRTGWIVAFLIALLITGCGTDTKDQLKPPSVYKNPQVKITHAPTDVVADIATLEAAESATPQVFDDNAEEPTLTTDEEDQALMDQIDGTLSELEDKLDRMDTNP